RLQSRAQVHVVTHDRVTKSSIRSHVAHDHRACIQADSDIKLCATRQHQNTSKIVDGVNHLQRCHHTTQGVILRLDRSSPETHHSISDELVEGTLMPINKRLHFREILIQKMHDFFRSHPL